MNRKNQATGKPRLMDRVRNVIRAKHYSIRTEEAYIRWIKKFILFHGKRHPGDMGAEEVNAFINHLAVNRKNESNKRIRKGKKGSQGSGPIGDRLHDCSLVVGVFYRG